MNQTRRPLAAFALIAVVALISACGSSAPAETGAGSAGAGTTGAGTTGAGTQKAVKFAECMRRNGVSNFPDPGASGQFTIDAVANGSSVNTSAPAFKQAASACKELEPAGFTGTKRSSRQQSAGLRFAECIRENGVKDFPDPAPNEPLVDTNLIPSSNRPGGMSILNAAMRKCGTLAAAAGAGR